MKHLLVLAALSMSALHAHEFHHHEGWLKLPEGLEHLGDSHGEIDVDSAGLIYVSVLGGEKSGIQVYSPAGEYLRNLPNARNNHHGFTIVREGDRDVIVASCLGDPETAILKLSTDGEILMEIPTSRIPIEEWKVVENKGVSKPKLALTHVDVSPTGEILLADGYSTDKLFIFNADGSFKKTIDGKQPPYSFDTLHKFAVDRRFEPARLLVCDRRNDRLVHLTLDGEFIGEFATGLRRPSSLDFHDDLVVCAEIAGRVSVMDKEGKIVATLGTNDTTEEVNTNRTEPEKWRTGVVTSPHGITFDHEGNILMTEWNNWGRILRWDLDHDHAH